MSRAQRLLGLLQELRGKRAPVAGQVLADSLGVSLRTLYRDIATLQQQGAEIEGEAGVGYVLKPGFMLPPLMFTAEEVEALVLGSRWVVQHGDPQLSAGAGSALAKISHVLTPVMRDRLEETPLLVPPTCARPQAVALADLRQALRDEQRVEIGYVDGEGKVSQRLVWPLALAFFETTRMLVAWCELRQDFRHFRADRIQSLRKLGERYPTRRSRLLRQWRQQENVSV